MYGFSSGFKAKVYLRPYQCVCAPVCVCVCVEQCLKKSSFGCIVLCVCVQLYLAKRHQLLHSDTNLLYNYFRRQRQAGGSNVA